MPNFIDYYQILGINKNASDKEIKTQYRKLAKQYHPDRNKDPHAEEKFKSIGEAYNVLNNKEKRTAYDELYEYQQQGGERQGTSFTPPPGWGFQGSQGGDFQSSSTHHFQQGDFSDFFESLFGNLRGGTGPGKAQRRQAFQQQGQDQRSQINITLEEAFEGGERLVQLQEPIQDLHTGRTTYRNKSLKIKIPAGMPQGQTMRLSGQGSPGMGDAPNGDLYLKINIEPHKTYTLSGKDILLNLPITPWEAALGKKIAIPTLGGRVDITIPSGSQTDQKMRLKGRGLPGATAGNQYVILKIQTPPAKTKEDKKHYEDMAQAMPFNPRDSL